MLRDLIDAAGAGSGQLVGIVGEPGAGKSRLLRELRRSLEGSSVRYVEIHGLAHGTLTPLLPVIEMVRAYLGVNEGDLPDAVRDKARAVLAALGADPDADAPYLLALLGIQEGNRGDGELVKRRIFDLFRRMVFALGRQSAFVLIVENGHWIDPTTEECFAFLAEHLAGTPFLLAMTYRPGYKPAWLDKSYATQLALSPLGSADGRRFISAVAEGREVPAPLSEQILARAEGNPLFLEELTRAVMDPAHAATGSNIPDTIHAVIAARIDHLSVEDKRLLQTAAVIGRDVPYVVLERVAGLDDEALHGGLARLQAAEFIVERGPASNAPMASSTRSPWPRRTRACPRRAAARSTFACSPPWSRLRGSGAASCSPRWPSMLTPEATGAGPSPTIGRRVFACSRAMRIAKPLAAWRRPSRRSAAWPPPASPKSWPSTATSASS